MLESDGKAIGFLRVQLADEGVHILLPVDFIMMVGPQFELSETIVSVREVKGRSIIHCKNGQAYSVRHTMDEIVEALNAKQIDEGPCITKPTEKKVVETGPVVILPPAHGKPN